ncbi:MAG TPA: avidin/streptavidin family protein [Mucilaginibacter sp.]|jgi:hypothetical protein
MKSRWLPFALGVFLLIGRAAYGQSNNDLIGVWHNEVNATLTITAISPVGKLTGTYVFQPGSAGAIFPLIGWVNPISTASKKDHVVPVLFMIRWDVYGSIVVWAGYLNKGNDGRFSITTIWNKVSGSADPDASLDQNEAKTAVFKAGPAQ